MNVWRDELWVAVDARGLYRWTGRHWVLEVEAADVEDAAAAFRKDALVHLAVGRNELLIVGVDGLHRFDGQAIEAFTTDVDSLFATRWTYGAMGFSDGRVAVGMADAGAVLLDETGKLIGRWNTDDGFLGNVFAEFGTDDEGGLWVCLENGIVRVDLEAPIEVFPGVTGMISDIEEVDGRVYVTTSAGFYRLDADAEPWTRFEEIEGANDFTGMLNTEDGFFVSSSGGISRRGPEGWTDSVYLNYPASLAKSEHHPQRLLALSRDGLHLLSTESDTLRLLATHELPVEASTMVETEAARLWIGTRSGVVLRVELAEDYSDVVQVEALGAEEGVPASQTFLVEHDDRLLLGSEWGLSVYRDGSFHPVEVSGLESGLLQDLQLHDDRLWALVDGDIGEFHTPSSLRHPWIWEETFSRSQYEGRAHAFFIHDDDVWASQSNRLVRWSVQTGPTPPGGFAPLLRRIVANSDSTIWAGVNAPAGVKLDYSQNSLRLEFASTTHRGEGSPVYRTRLDGHDAQWSEWTSVPYREYTNLGEGSYIFRLVAQDAYGALSSELAFQITIMPPWSRTLAARLGFLVGALLLVMVLSVLASRFRSRQLARRNHELEGSVRERTEDLRLANSDLHRTNRELAHVNQELRHLDEQRNELLGMAAHDLKSPITSIRSITELLEDDADPRVAECRVGRDDP